MVALPSPLYCVLSLIAAFLGLAGLYLSLGAEFLAVVQVVVYAGAIMVLFLFVIMMLDIDFFKHYNDNNGHLKGDKVLRDIAQVMLRFSRETDITARYGGEEFVMILPETDGKNSRLLGDRIRVSVEEMEFEGQHKIPTENVTISIGVSCLTSDEDGHEALERADQALYKSKQNGKNQITILG